METALQYVGKKGSFSFKNPRFKHPIPFSKKKGEVTWLNESDADWLLLHSPNAFIKAGERGSEAPVALEDAADIIANKKKLDSEDSDDNLSMDSAETEMALSEEAEETEEEDAEEEKIVGAVLGFPVCPKCGKVYKRAQAAVRFFNKHVESCEG